ncbi:MAG TPA: hypothetical protein VN493_26095 [Thermoanaerobaculia bacterium]|nr:hypothetical protein [Thermoanaerobaculia bacterium]
MKATLLAFTALFAATQAAGQPIEVRSARGNLVRGEPKIVITFSGEIPAALEAQVLNPDTYTVTVPVPTRATDIVPATEETTLEVSGATFGRNNSVVFLHFSGITYGTGTIEIPEMTAEGVTIEGKSEIWEIGQIYDTPPTFTHDQSLRFQSKTAVADFSFTYAGFHWTPKDEGEPYRFSATLEGSAPLGTPQDVEEEPDADPDASEDVADFFKLSLLRTGFGGKGLLKSYGLVARSTAQFEGLEAVATYQLARLFNDNRMFGAAEIEAGYRRGDAEWTSLTQPAPDRGDTVARVGAVLEWGPRLGPINRDLGAGLRFFVRGRGWADWADDETGEGDVRFRGFLDSELFYNVSDEFRVFLRYENGYLPPDLSQRHSSTFVGVGTAF